jgi:hypothetical protein
MGENQEYDPAEDEGVKKLEEMRASGASEEEILKQELALTEQTNNGLKDTDVIDS